MRGKVAKKIKKMAGGDRRLHQQMKKVWINIPSNKKKLKEREIK